MCDIELSFIRKIAQYALIRHFIRYKFLAPDLVHIDLIASPIGPLEAGCTVVLVSAMLRL